MPAIEHASAQSPASNHYSPNEKASSRRPRIRMANFNQDANQKPALVPYKRDDSPSPNSY